MNQPSKHLLAIRDGRTIDATDIDERREAFREACRAMRKYLSPVLKPAPSWFARVDKMRTLCGLETDGRIVAELLAARLAAQIDDCAAPGELDDLMLAAGLTLIPSWLLASLPTITKTCTLLNCTVLSSSWIACRRTCPVIRQLQQCRPKSLSPQCPRHQIAWIISGETSRHSLEPSRPAMTGPNRTLTTSSAAWIA